MRSPNDARERALKLLASATESNGFEQHAKIWMVLAVLDDALAIWKERVEEEIAVQ
jgi:hypothetical protein